ncbi:MAG: Lrp/AsnC family transcriptional regulator [Paracoccaceae bacterium]
MLEIDETDRRILRHLQETPELPVAELALRARLSAGSCWRRVERLRAAGVIRGTGIVIDYRRLGYSVEVFLRITLDKTEANAFDEFLRAAREVPEVTAIQTLLGRVDVRMDVRARNLEHYQQIYKTRILSLPHIADIEALMLVSEIKNTAKLPL